MSFQLNGTPVASGVVNRLDSVMTILCGSPLAPLTSRKPSAPAPPALLIDDHRLLHQIVLGDDALDEARHLVGAAAGAGGDDELDRAVGSQAFAAGAKRLAAMAVAATRAQRAIAC